MTTIEKIREFLSGIVAYIDDLPASETAVEPPKPGWISVKDRLPIERQALVGKVKGAPCSALCLVVVEDPFSVKIVSTDMTIHGEWYNYGSTVTHWMPLPEPPKEEENDQ